MKPTPASPLACPEIVQVTAVLEVPVTVAVKLVLTPAWTFIVVGLTATAIPVFARTCAFTEAEETAPGSGFFTVIAIVPTCPLVAVPVAVNCVEETRVVVKAALPK